MSEPKVSIIVPVYNASDYICRCMDSLINQSLEDIEIIAINDGSTDDSLEILKEYEKTDSRVTVLTQEDLGQGNAVNRGFDLARGKYVAECDSDDFARTDMYEKLYTAAEQDNCDVVRCSYVEYYSNDKLRSFTMIPTQYCNKVYKLTELPLRERAAFIWCSVLLMPAIARREFLIKEGIRYREQKIFEDTSLSFKIRTAAERYKFIPDYLYFYNRSNPQSGSMTIKDKFSICEQYEEICRWNKERGYGLEKEIATVRYYSYEWNISRMQNTQDQIEFLLHAREEFKKEEVIPELFHTPEDYEAYTLIRDGELITANEKGGAEQ